MLEDERQVENTRIKLKRLEERYEQEKEGPPSWARRVTLRSLKRTINQFKEEIAVFQAHHPAGSGGASS
ncbi:MAG: hypothetical protein WED34_07180 [Planctomycetales bacterium]